jgi:hypothetical protein
LLKVDSPRNRQQNSLTTVSEYSHNPRKRSRKEPTRSTTLRNPPYAPTHRSNPHSPPVPPPTLQTTASPISRRQQSRNRGASEGLQVGSEAREGDSRREAKQVRSVQALSERESRARRGGVGVFAWIHCREERERRGSGGENAGYRLAKAAVSETNQYGESVRGRECGTHRASRSDSRRARMSFSRTGPLTFLQFDQQAQSASRAHRARADRPPRVRQPTGQWSGSRRP